MKLTKRQMTLFKLHLYSYLRHNYNPNLDIDKLDDLDEYCNIMSIDDATTEEQVKYRNKSLYYSSSAKSYVINVRVCDQTDHNKGRLMKFFVTSVDFTPYQFPETIVDMKPMSNMVYKLEK